MYHNINWIKWILIGFGVFNVYVIMGAILPYAFIKKVSKENTAIQESSEFYGETVSADRAAIVESNEEALNIRLAMFEEAKSSIILTTFDMREGKSTQKMISSLLAAADRGVNIKIIVDGIYGILHMTGKEIFELAGSHPNIEIKFYNIPNLLKPWTINARMHDKYIIVDDKLLLLGGRNSFDYFVGNYPGESTGYDREVLIYNTDYENGSKKSVIDSVKIYFNTIWEGKCCKTVFHKGYEKNKMKLQELLKTYYSKSSETEYNWMEYTVSTDKVTFISNPSNLGPKEPVLWEQIKQLLLSAEEEVIIQSPYAVLSKQMYQDLNEIEKTVPEATLLLNSIAIGDNIMASSDYIKNKDKVIETGLQIYEYFGNHSSHSKSVTIDDDISIIGSYNLDMRSTYVNSEVMLVIDSQELNYNLKREMKEFQEYSLLVNKDGSYEKSQKVKEDTIPDNKKRILAILSKVVIAVRYLL